MRLASSISFVNGTCQCPNATVGDTAVINGVTYTAVDNSTIAGEIANGNVNLCTHWLLYDQACFETILLSTLILVFGIQQQLMI